MFSHRHYVPVLKWKQGEYQALQRLASPTKDALTPLLEIPGVGFDHEAGTNRETVDSHLGDFARRLKSKWGARNCFVDLKYIDPAARMADGRHPLEAVFDDLRTEGCRAVPVVGLGRDAAYSRAVAAVIRADRRGVCLRLEVGDFDRADLGADITALLTTLGVGHADTDLVVDYGAPNFQPINAYVRVMLTLNAMVPVLNRWRSYTVVATSYPSTIAGIVGRPFTVIPRNEWVAYQALVARLGEARIPTFGDYAVAHPDPVELDMRFIKPFAKLRYTFEDSWHIGRGDTVRTHGFGQYQQLCRDVTGQAYFSGPHFSSGDQYIADCAAGTAATGNLTTWVWVSTNRHLTKVVDDLAIFHGLSAAAE